MSKLRSLIAVASIVFALVPVGAQAGSNEDQIAMNQAMVAAAEQQANMANDLARCKLASTGVAVPGTVGFSQPAPTGGCSGIATPVPTTEATSGGGKCVSAMRPLTKFEFDQVNEFVIAAARAIANSLPPVAMSDDVKALIGC